MVKRSLPAIVVLIGLLGAALLFAQTPTVNTGEAFSLRGTHNGANTTTYHLAITGPTTYSADLPISALSGGTITFAVPGLSQQGNYSAIITATGPGGSTPSAPFAFVVVAPAPAAVTGITLIRG